METALTANEVAQFLKVSPRTVCKLAAKGEIPGRKIGNRWRFSQQAILLWLAGALVPLNKSAELDLKGVWKKGSTGNHHLDFFGCLASNPLSQEVADFVQAEKERQRQEAIVEADAYDNR
jgi:excisionase family DNA binding protein